MDILGIRIDEVSMQQATDRILSMLKSNRFHYVCTPNPEILYKGYQNPDFARILNHSDMNTADGIGVIYAAKIYGRALPERVSGFDLALALLKELSHEGYCVYLLGSAPGVAKEASQVLQKQFPGLKIAGVQDGYFKDDAPIIDEINRSGADVLFVCLGSPKQELWIDKNKDKLRVRLAMGLGGTLDGISGRTKRAPALIIRLNLEWLYRLLCEPKRLFRMMSLPAFMITVLANRMRGKCI